ncbi:ATP-dependent RNA helicase DBP10, putative [Plasmodium knowlesi strain H]|uniref:ATP-dependent RNA helicase DBP10, putative n=3 Tax=Plasmodium knowlesi TaxID=5850 RepID=A0A5K1U224_PLAKH|nr:ATP-dependent RNA helicase DBP10, putative [Plasmodium knowlesi strain H]OTN68090.1 putative ATP-dependent RNA helicase DBP10 [Plasmodium knowlesi]CAA9990249.1 ATP-dependent RNA helicase DBP10, putative [Plasmodium knowlesi strain H]SBO26801.1 ATP-dependent RNA helicase DBP10, putative [Plasmodium knowlesi strain H]SBO28429.1 ATP-dependent RNA helicase DBP10, putative [Plasmodium knowlesi strain H]VVS79723.1 ATP-dependent RNA helicase DBP10, putative [Plasmodium knowlesi strain H]|eukprot:XP_002258052.1 DEAD-box family helicase, putative [Plasmodium knowlesi strain H]
MKIKKARTKGGAARVGKGKKKLSKGSSTKSGVLQRKAKVNTSRSKKTTSMVKKPVRSGSSKRYSWLFEKEGEKTHASSKKGRKINRLGGDNFHSDEDQEEGESANTIQQDGRAKEKKKKFVLYKNKKGKKNKNKKGMLTCFHYLGLSEKMCRSISSNLKYNRPTDIQKLCIPKIIQRKDIICISKTGTGKSLVYVSTMIDLLAEHSQYFGVRGLVLVPTKELAIQIFKLSKKICKNFFNLKINVIIGGISLNKQFDMLKENLDVLICTPGRLSFILKETNLSLEKVEILIIDEADRLLELNYFNDMNNIYKSLNRTNKQTLLISATLPTDVQNYFKLKLNNPDVLSLSSDNTISDKMNLHFLFTRSYEKYGLLIKLIFLFKKRKLGKTIIFFCTKYHILFFSKILSHLKIAHAMLYGNSDTSYRLDQIKKFTNNEEIQFMLVTDVAARGINITSVQNVINYSLPFSPKLFIHRVGRACRDDAMPSGYAVSLVTYQDILYAYEICFFIGKKLKFFRRAENAENVNTSKADELVDTDTQNDVDIAKMDETERIAKKNEPEGIAKTNETEGIAHAPLHRDVVYLGSLNHISDYVELVDNQKNADEELVSLNKSILASYKLYYAMRPKVSKYASTECINKINKIGGVYKLCLFYHPDEIYENHSSGATKEEMLPSGKQSNVENIAQLENISGNGVISSPNEGEVDRNEIMKEGETSTEDAIIEQPKNYTHNELMTIIHNFQCNDTGKVKGISEDIKDKLNKLKEKMHTTKRGRSGEVTDDMDELMGALAMGLSDNDQGSDYELEHLWKDRENGSGNNSGEGQKEPSNKPKKMSKRALKKMKKQQQQAKQQQEQDQQAQQQQEQDQQVEQQKEQKGEEPTSGVLPTSGGTKRSNVDIPFDDILKKINKKKMKQEGATAFAIKTPGFDLPPDEEEELNKQRFIKKKVWDTRKRKFVLQEIDTFQSDGFKKKDRRKDAGESGKGNHAEGAAAEPTGSLYQKWVKRTKNRIKNVGELEDEMNKNGRNIFMKTKRAHNHSQDDTTSTQLDEEKQTHLQMLKQNHPEITDSLSRNIKLTKKQQRLYKKYLSGKYMDSEPNSSLHKSLPQMQKEKAKMLQKKLRTDKNFRMKYARMKKKRHEKKLREKENLKSARSRSLAIVRKKKIGKRGG